MSKDNVGLEYVVPEELKMKKKRLRGGHSINQKFMTVDNPPHTVDTPARTNNSLSIKFRRFFLLLYLRAGFVMAGATTPRKQFIYLQKILFSTSLYSIVNRTFMKH
ncbi:hypothetical protein WA026_023858 [Henosepilachna vigintioctopunctata]|uniref:Uncharacterized protein n=1 Tax=Henosepilachna vigintioctopunctata TaxID=420089 RepID=A0AAW1TZ93_9CUCU